MTERLEIYLRRKVVDFMYAIEPLARAPSSGRSWAGTLR
jgi:hypothetical protein